MAVQPRVIFTRFSSVESPGFRPWIDHIARVLGPSAPLQPTFQNPTVWQLVSANNRELARSASLFEGFRAANQAAESTVGSLANAVTHSVVDERRGLQGWYLSVEGRAEVVCSRWYFADRERTHAVSIALSALAHASLGEGARVQIERDSRAPSERVY
jgi:hypothetical protein